MRKDVIKIVGKADKYHLISDWTATYLDTPVKPSLNYDDIGRIKKRFNLRNESDKPSDKQVYLEEAVLIVGKRVPKTILHSVLHASLSAVGGVTVVTAYVACKVADVESVPQLVGFPSDSTKILEIKSPRLTLVLCKWQPCNVVELHIGEVCIYVYVEAFNKPGIEPQTSRMNIHLSNVREQFDAELVNYIGVSGADFELAYELKNDLIGCLTLLGTVGGVVDA